MALRLFVTAFFFSRHLYKDSHDSHDVMVEDRYPATQGTSSRRHGFLLGNSIPDIA